MQKAQLILETKKERSVSIQAGWYSERAMAADLGWSAYFGWHVKPCTVYKTIYSK